VLVTQSLFDKARKWQTIVSGGCFLNGSREEGSDRLETAALVGGLNKATNWHQMPHQGARQTHSRGYPAGFLRP